VQKAGGLLQAYSHPKVFSFLLLRRDSLLLLLFWLHLRHMGAAVRYIVPQRRSQLFAVVGEDLRVVCAARDGDVDHAVVEQVFGPSSVSTWINTRSEVCPWLE